MKTTKLHVAMFPWFAMGHLTPFLHLSNKLADRGYKVSFLVPTKTQSRLQHLNLHPNLITFIPLTVPHVQGLPLGAETMSDVPISMAPLVAIALDLMQHQLELLLLNLNPDVIFFDFAHWIPNFARRQCCKSILYSVIGASSFSYFLVPVFQLRKDQEFIEFDLMHPPPGYPHSWMQLRLCEATAGLFLSREFGNSGMTFHERLTISTRESDAISFRSCREIEEPCLNYMESQYSKPILLAGPLLPEQTTLTLEEQWVQWLGSFKEGSVVYCAFGSECILKKDQFLELILGLEQTGLPFLVASKPPFGVEAVEEALPKGFKERVGGRGVVHGGWVQQQLILKHPSVGCFVSHCGSSSTWEGLMSDCQIVLVPHIFDQFISAKVMCGALKVAVEVERREDDGWFSREDVCKAVKSVMSEENDVAIEIRHNHAKLKSILLSEGFESSYMDSFVTKLEDLVHSG